MWNGFDERVAANFGERASVLRLLHLRSSVRLVHFDRYMMVPSLLCSTASAAISSIAEPESDTMRYIAAGLALSAGMLVAINKHLKFSERSFAHKRSANAYGKLNRLVTVEMALDRSRRKKSDDLLTKVRHTMDSVTEESPLIEQCVVDNFMSSFSNTENICLPEVCSGLSRIMVRDETEQP